MGHERLRRARWIAPIAVLWASACTLEPTEVLVVVDSNAPLDRTMDLTATIALEGSSTPEHRAWVRGPGVPGSIALPASFAVVPPSSGQRDAVVSVGLHLHVEAGSTGQPAIDFDRTARFALLPHQTAVLRVYLPLECGAASHGCATVPDARCTFGQRCEDMHQTCGDDARCVAPEVTPVPLAHDDAGVDASVRPDVARMDTGVDAPARTDVVRADAPVDVAVDAPADVPVDAPRDVPTDACPASAQCLPGATRDAPCGNCGTRRDTCSASCMWTMGTCAGEGACSPGATRAVDCGPCAHETDTCNASCAWVAGSCSGSCCMPIAGCTGGNSIGGVCTGSGDDGCGGSCTCDAVNGEACSAGSGVGSCCHTSGWFCSDVSQCCPGLSCVGNICM